MKIDFEFTHPIYGIFRDALTLPDDHAYSDAEIEAMKQQRFDNWIAIITAPPPDVIEEPEVIVEPTDNTEPTE